MTPRRTAAEDQRGRALARFVTTDDAVRILVHILLLHIRCTGAGGGELLPRNWSRPDPRVFVGYKVAGLELRPLITALHRSLTHSTDRGGGYDGRDRLCILYLCFRLREPSTATIFVKSNGSVLVDFFFF